MNFDALQDCHYLSGLVHALTGQDVLYPLLHKLKNRPEIRQTTQYLSEYESDAAKEAEREEQYLHLLVRNGTRYLDTLQ